jgi:hypothetical protein
MAWSKDAAIIAQNSATVAAALVQRVVISDIDEFDEFLALFDKVRTHVFEGSLALAGVTSPDEIPADTRNNGGGGRRPASDPGAITVDMGTKHKGKTIAAIYVEDPEYVSNFLADKCNNDFLRRNARAFLQGLGK